MPQLTFEQVTKVYSDGTVAVSALDLEVPDGYLGVLIGPSGCGKTTLLRMLAGLEIISKGFIRIGDRVINDVPAKQRDIPMVFQNYALYPHMTVYDNMAFSLKLRHVKRREIEARVNLARLSPMSKACTRSLAGIVCLLTRPSSPSGRP